MVRSVSIFAVRHRQLLLILRDDKNWIKNPFRWGLPSGAIEPDEDPETAAARECKEELGISIPLHRLKALSETTAFFVTELSGNEDIILGEGCAYGYFTIEALIRLCDEMGEHKAGLADNLVSTLIAHAAELTSFLNSSIVPEPAVFC